MTDVNVQRLFFFLSFVASALYKVADHIQIKQTDAHADTELYSVFLTIM